MTALRSLFLALAAPALLCAAEPARAVTLTDVVIAFDASDSIDAHAFVHLTNAIHTGISDQTAAPRDGTYGLGLVQFGTTATALAPYGTLTDANVVTGYEVPLFGAIGSSGETNTGAAIDLAQSLLPTGTSARQVIVLITDGTPNVGNPSGVQHALEQAMEAKSAGIEIHVIGVGSLYDGSVLEGISSGTGYVSQTSGYAGVDNLTTTLLTVLNTYRPGTPDPNAGGGSGGDVGGGTGGDHQVPEPATLALLGLGLAGVALRRRG